MKRHSFPCFLKHGVLKTSPCSYHEQGLCLCASYGYTVLQTTQIGKGLSMRSIVTYLFSVVVIWCGVIGAQDKWGGYTATLYNNYHAIIVAKAEQQSAEAIAQAVSAKESTIRHGWSLLGFRSSWWNVESWSATKPNVTLLKKAYEHALRVASNPQKQEEAGAVILEIMRDKVYEENGLIKNFVDNIKPVIMAIIGGFLVGRMLP